MRSEGSWSTGRYYPIIVIEDLEKGCTYFMEHDGGIYHCELKNGNVEIKEKTELDRPMYMTVADNKMYVILREAFENGESGMCSFDIDNSGKLINQSGIVSTKGIVACHIYANSSDVYAVNYLSGTAIRFPDTVVKHKGKGINPKRQEMPHTHYVGITPDERYICVTDLGLDKICFYDKDLNFKFDIDVPSGHGARHLAFSEDGKYLYCINELMSTVSVFIYDGKNTRILNTYSALPPDFSGHNQAAAIRVYKNKVYASNRGHGSIAVFDICGDELIPDGFIQTGREPRDFNITDDILISCNMSDDTVTLYDLNNNRKSLMSLQIKKPICAV